MIEAKYLDIIIGLVEKSRKDEINWRNANEFSALGNPTSEDYAFSTPEYTLEVFKVEGFGEGGISLNIYNPKAELVLHIESSTNEEYKMLGELLDLARSKTLDEKKVIESVLNSLKSENILGKQDERNEGDIPF
jgi:hypothetical protein